jgi:DNA polymerase-3 subunit gamma/tau
MSHIALYRKYRPASFEEVTGQEHITRALGHAVDRGNFVHAFLFTGPRGCGKTTTARLLAQALECDKGPTSKPCGECVFCRGIPAGRCVDVVEMDAASETGIDDIRESVIERAKYSPLEARYKIYIIDEVHDLSSKAFDALLKTIEEPPAHVIFILATTDPNKVPPTIRSRCQRHDFRRGSLPDLVKRLGEVAEREGIAAEPAAIAAIAQMADGGYRDALSLLEQVSATASGKLDLAAVTDSLGLVPDDVAVGLLQAAADGDGAKLLGLLDEVIAAGREPRTVLESLIHKVEELVRAAHGAKMAGIAADRQAILHEQAVRIGKPGLMRIWPALAEAHGKLRTAGLPRLWLEIVLLGLAQAPQTPPAAAPTQEPAAPPRERKPAEPKPGPPPALSAKPTVEELGAVWEHLLTELRAKSKGAAITLAGSRIVAVAGKHATLEVSSPRMYEKLLDGRFSASKELTDSFRKAVGDTGWSLGYRLAAATPEPPKEPAGVPMPLEGEDLERAVQEELGGERIANGK